MPRWMPNNASEWKRLTLPVLMLTLSMPLAGCATMMGISVPISFVDTSCKAFRPISWSKHDTDQTIREVKGHNAVYDKLCPVAK